MPGGAAEGAAQGGAAAGLPGAIVGGASAAWWAESPACSASSNGRASAPYVVEQHRPSYAYREQVRVGVQLPAEGVQYYEVPAEYGARGYRYTVVNERPVLVDRSHRIVE